ncbi:hypothetical protein R3P38DRAFT_3238663 [Favolaschia claudopus]|uniref:Uncharacterized protein n=1 Tax=Favolaschia claudopus TaxID=2862362 RepID=A0AAV9ZA03_9AGAR
MTYLPELTSPRIQRNVSRIPYRPCSTPDASTPLRTSNIPTLRLAFPFTSCLSPSSFVPLPHLTSRLSYCYATLSQSLSGGGSRGTWEWSEYGGEGMDVNGKRMLLRLRLNLDRYDMEIVGEAMVVHMMGWYGVSPLYDVYSSRLLGWVIHLVRGRAGKEVSSKSRSRSSFCSGASTSTLHLALDVPIHSIQIHLDLDSLTPHPQPALRSLPPHALPDTIERPIPCPQRRLASTRGKSEARCCIHLVTCVGTRTLPIQGRTYRW